MSKELKEYGTHLKHVILNTMSFGRIEMSWEWYDNKQCIINVHGLGLIRLNYVISQDVKGFEKLNAISDERHQISIDTLLFQRIELFEGVIPAVRIYYDFQQGDSSKWRRTCSGNLSDLKLVTPDMTKYIEGKTQYYGLNLYPYNCVVYW